MAQYSQADRMYDLNTSPGSVVTETLDMASFFVHSPPTGIDCSLYTYDNCQITEYNQGTGACSTSTAGVRPTLARIGSVPSTSY